jgi:hypothetical protein
VLTNVHEVDIHGSYFKLLQFVIEKCRHKEISQTPLCIPARQTAPGEIKSGKWIKALQHGAIVNTSIHRLLGYRLLHLLWNNGTETGPPVPSDDEGCGKY